jgi:hypothetical protein
VAGKVHSILYSIYQLALLLTRFTHTCCCFAQRQLQHQLQQRLPRCCQVNAHGWVLLQLVSGQQLP